jgi:two-component system, NarL family, nitrate/nitrite response regulator NarL
MMTVLDTQGANELTVVLADHHVPTRAGVRSALEADGLRVVAEAGTAAAAVEAACRLKPDVCLLAVHLPGDGIEATRQITDALPDTKIVMLTASEREEDLFAALRAGADGYLLKSIAPARLPHAVRGVASGEAALPREMTARLIREYRDRGRRSVPRLVVEGNVVELTVREFEVLERLRKHERTAEIAAHLGISEITVRRHVSTAMHKLGTPNRHSTIELLQSAEHAEHGTPVLAAA